MLMSTGGYFTFSSAPESGDEQEYARAVAGGGEHHALGDAEFHLARGEVGDHHREPALELLRVVGGLDAREHGFRRAAEVERELQQLVRAFDRLGVDDLRDAEIDLVEIVDRDRAWHGVGFHGMLLAVQRGAVGNVGCGVGCRVSLLDFDERFNLLSFNTSH